MLVYSLPWLKFESVKYLICIDDSMPLIMAYISHSYTILDFSSTFGQSGQHIELVITNQLHDKKWKEICCVSFSKKKIYVVCHNNVSSCMISSTRLSWLFQWLTVDSSFLNWTRLARVAKFNVHNVSHKSSSWGLTWTSISVLESSPGY